MRHTQHSDIICANETWKYIHDMQWTNGRDRKENEETQKKKSSAVHTHTHSVPGENTAVLTPWRLTLVVFAFSPTDKSRVTPHCAVYLVGHVQRTLGVRAVLMRVSFSPITSSFKQNLKSCRCWRSIRSASSQDDNVLTTSINPDPTLLWSNVMNSMTTICSLFLFSLSELPEYVYSIVPTANFMIQPFCNF